MASELDGTRFPIKCQLDERRRNDPTKLSLTTIYLMAISILVNYVLLRDGLTTIMPIIVMLDVIILSVVAPAQESHPAPEHN